MPLTYVNTPESCRRQPIDPVRREMLRGLVAYARDIDLDQLQTLVDAASVYAERAHDADQFNHLQSLRFVPAGTGGEPCPA